MGIIAAPQRPIIPVARMRLSSDATMSVPVRCCVSPIAQSVDDRGPRAYISAARRIRSRRHTRDRLGTFGRVRLDGSRHLVEPVRPFGDEALVVEIHPDDVVQHRVEQRDVGAG